MSVVTTSEFCESVYSSYPTAPNNISICAGPSENLEPFQVAVGDKYGNIDGSCFTCYLGTGNTTYESTATPTVREYLPGLSTYEYDGANVAPFPLIGTSDTSCGVLGGRTQLPLYCYSSQDLTHFWPLMVNGSQRQVTACMDKPESTRCSSTSGYLNTKFAIVDGSNACTTNDSKCGQPEPYNCSQKAIKCGTIGGLTVLEEGFTTEYCGSPTPVCTYPNMVYDGGYCYDTSCNPETYCTNSGKTFNGTACVVPTSGGTTTSGSGGTTSGGTTSGGTTSGSGGTTSGGTTSGSGGTTSGGTTSGGTTSGTGTTGTGTTSGTGTGTGTGPASDTTCKYEENNPLFSTNCKYRPPGTSQNPTPEPAPCALATFESSPPSQNCSAQQTACEDYIKTDTYWCGTGGSGCTCKEVTEPAPSYEGGVFKRIAEWSTNRNTWGPFVGSCKTEMQCSNGQRFTNKPTDSSCESLPKSTGCYLPQDESGTGTNGTGTGGTGTNGTGTSGTGNNDPYQCGDYWWSIDELSWCAAQGREHPSGTGTGGTGTGGTGTGGTGTGETGTGTTATSGATATEFVEKECVANGGVIVNGVCNSKGGETTNVDLAKPFTLDGKSPKEAFDGMMKSFMTSVSIPTPGSFTCPLDWGVPGLDRNIGKVSFSFKGFTYTSDNTLEVMLCNQVGPLLLSITFYTLLISTVYKAIKYR